VLSLTLKPLARMSFGKNMELIKKLRIFMKKAKKIVTKPFMAAPECPPGPICYFCRSKNMTFFPKVGDDVSCPDCKAQVFGTYDETGLYSLEWYEAEGDEKTFIDDF
jgi:hypothetical protein